MRFTKDDTQKCKGAAILLMIFHHMYREVWVYSGYSINFYPLSEAGAVNLADFCKLCVGIYAFLSAYGLTCAYRKWKESASGFVLCRYVKMMMVFWVVYLLAVLTSFSVGRGRWELMTVYAGDEVGISGTLFYILTDAMGLAHLFHTPSLDGAWWYMSFAFAVLLLIPVLNRLCDHFREEYLILASLIVPAAFGLAVEENSLIIWLPVVALGISCARRNWLSELMEHMEELPAVRKLAELCGWLVLLYCLFRPRQGPLKNQFLPLWDSLVPFLVIILLFLYINRLKGFGDILRFFGKYSTLIYLTHGFTQMFGNLTYPFTCAWLNYTIFVAESLVIAVALDLGLKLVRFRDLEDYVEKSLEKKFAGR